MTLSFYRQEEFSSFGSLGSNPSTCSTRTNLSQSVELALAPLIEELISYNPSKERAAREERGNRPVPLLLQSLELSVSRLVQAAETIAYENDSKSQIRMLSAVHRLKASAKRLKQLVASSPGCVLSETWQEQMSVREGARLLLYDVVSVLSVADKMDVRKLVEVAHSVDSCIESLRDVVCVKELYQQISQFTPVMAKLVKLAQQRQDELDCSKENSCLVESLSWYCRALRVGCILLISSCKCYVRHPDLETARNNRDFAFDLILHAANTISRTVKENFVPPDFTLEIGGDFSQKIASLQLLSLLPPDELTGPKRLLTQLRETADSVAELVSTREEHRTELNHFSVQTQQYLADENKLFDLLSQESRLNDTCESLCHAVDLSNLDALLDLHSNLKEPLQELNSAVKSSSFEKVQEAFDSFFQLTERILQVSESISSSCAEAQGTRLIKLSSQQLTRLATQLTHAARSYWQRQRSRYAWNCFVTVGELWEHELSLLLDSLDSVLPLTNFLLVVELHLRQYLTNSAVAIETQDLTAVFSHREGIQSVCSRLLSIVEGFLTDGDVYMPLETQQSVNTLLSKLRGELFRFNEEINRIELTLSESTSSSVDASLYDKITRNISELVMSVKKSIEQLLRDEERSDFENNGNILELLGSSPSEQSIFCTSEVRATPYRQVSFVRSSLSPSEEGTQVQEIFRSLSPPEKLRLESARQDFHVEQVRLETAVAKWDETENDVIFLAKEMCVMMMDMSNFTIGEGPINKPHELIQAANKLASSSQQLESLITRIIEHCNDGNSKNDLQAYMSESKLYAHQIKMTSKVYEDLSLIRFNTDSLSSIVISSKNLLNTVVKLVMASYIACNKIARSDDGGTQLRLIKWRRRPPSKKPLCRTSSAYSLSSSASHTSRPGTGRLSSARLANAPSKVLDEFEVELNGSIAYV